MKHLILILSTLIVVGCQIKIYDSSDNNRLLIKGYKLPLIKDTIPIFRWKYYAYGEFVSKTCKFRLINDGSYRGTSKYYYHTGNIAGKDRYKNGKLNGRHISYYHDGKVEMIAYFKNDRNYGSYKVYYPSGVISVAGNYGKIRNLEFEGTEIDTNIIKATETIEVGTWTKYDSLGVKTEEGRYSGDGILIYEPPEMIVNGIHVGGGIKIIPLKEGKWYYYHKGLIVGIEVYKNGKLISFE